MHTETEIPQATGSFTTAVQTADRGARLSLLWVFAMLNYLYCDVLGLMDTTSLKQYLNGEVNGIEVSQGFLLGAAILMEIPIAMVLLSSVLPARGSRWANIVAGMIMTMVQITTLFMAGLTAFYGFFSLIEIGTTAFIVWYAWRWHILQSQARTST
jgi:MFS family permease